VGFTLPLLLPVARCALTAPFHPYSIKSGLFSAALSVGLASPQALPGTLVLGARTFLCINTATTQLALSKHNTKTQKLQ